MLKPILPVDSNLIIELNRGNPAEWVYSTKTPFDDGTISTITFRNTYGQAVDTWQGEVVDGKLHFSADTSSTDFLPLGTSWVLMADQGEGQRMYAQGIVVRNEAPFPNAPAMSNAAPPVQYSYSFGTPGVVTDLVWTILTGHPQVYDNSEFSVPNAVAAGNLSGSYDSVCMLYYAPLTTESVRATYTVITGNVGEAWVGFSSKYDATNYVAFRHTKGSPDKVSIAVGSGPLTLADEVSTNHTTAYENFTVSYNPSSNTYAMYVGTDTTPLLEWVDSANVIGHGSGDRYALLGFKSNTSGPGPEICNWRIADAV